MAKVPTPAAAAEKYSRVASTRQTDYDSGVRNPSVDWAGATAAAKPSWEQGIDQAKARNGFQKGVTQAGNQKWLDKTTKVGSPRWAGGVRDAASDYETAITPVL